MLSNLMPRGYLDICRWDIQNPWKQDDYPLELITYSFNVNCTSLLVSLGQRFYLICIKFLPTPCGGCFMRQWFLRAGSPLEFRQCLVPMDTSRTLFVTQKYLNQHKQSHEEFPECLEILLWCETAGFSTFVLLIPLYRWAPGPQESTTLPLPPAVSQSPKSLGLFHIIYNIQDRCFSTLK